MYVCIFAVGMYITTCLAHKSRRQLFTSENSLNTDIGRHIFLRFQSLYSYIDSKPFRLCIYTYIRTNHRSGLLTRSLGIT